MTNEELIKSAKEYGKKLYPVVPQRTEGGKEISFTEFIETLGWKPEKHEQKENS
jgi:hypothetical protein